jgi:hypothetical protein
MSKTYAGEEVCDQQLTDNLWTDHFQPFKNLQVLELVGVVDVDYLERPLQLGHNIHADECVHCAGTENVLPGPNAFNGTAKNYLSGLPSIGKMLKPSIARGPILQSLGQFLSKCGINGRQLVAHDLMPRVEPCLDGNHVRKRVPLVDL